VLVRELKLKLTKAQTLQLEEWLWCLTGVYNWASRKIELGANDRIYHSKFKLQNSLARVSKKIQIPSHVIQATIIQAHDTWDRCLKKKARGQICSNCGALSGPSRLGGLKVRRWGCRVCGTQLDRVINSALVILKTGFGWSLGVLESSGGVR